MRTQKKAKWEIKLEEKRYRDSQDRARLDDLTHADAFKAFSESTQPQGNKAQHSHESGDHCPSCFNAGYDSGVISARTDTVDELNDLAAQAAQLAEALRAVRDAYQQMFDVMPVAWQTYDHIVTEALSAYEAAQ